MIKHNLIILDRDGVINQDNPGYVRTHEEWIPLAGSLDGIAYFTQAGWRVVIASNQSGLGRKFFSMEDLNEMHRKMHKLVNQAGGRIDGIFFCPHTPEDHCACRKPQPGMLLDISERFSVPLNQLIMIGDSLRDLQAIHSVGGQAILVRTGNGQQTLTHENLPPNTRIFDNLIQAAHTLVTEYPLY
jgi:D-glycero-D-manno-heptose 1,7-bisphosphate phosphatase